jgi:hypothetical protein
LRAGRIAAGAIWSVALGGAAIAEDPPLPEGNAYVRTVLGGARPQDAAIDDYSYDLEEVKESLDRDGKTSSRETLRYEVYFVRTRPVRRLVSRNGVRLGEREQAEVNRRAEAQAKAIAEGKTVSEQVGVRLGALLDSFVFKTIDREERNGRKTLILDFEPRKSAPAPPSTHPPRDAVAKILSGRLQIDEADRRVAHLLAWNTAGQTASVATGVKVGAFELSMEFVPVEDSVWLPKKVVSLAAGRAFLFKTFRIRRTTIYSNYRKFKVETTEKPKA